ncbi:hypothetical protein TWF481_011391 [Arthrobotrys musiformis]|uniref:Uncharacterized protein n=1 Tax=Arthrobotrys musiformis TaxID=47236 RepID=A0AAV9VYB0_9PEZI
MLWDPDAPTSTLAPTSHVVPANAGLLFAQDPTSGSGTPAAATTTTTSVTATTTEGPETTTTVGKARKESKENPPNSPAPHAPNVENERAVHHTMFWTKWKSVCPSVDEILAMPRDPHSYIMIGNKRRFEAHWGRAPPTINAVSITILKCHRCICEEDGTLSPDFLPGGLKRHRNDIGHNCNSWNDVQKCIYWYSKVTPPISRQKHVYNYCIDANLLADQKDCRCQTEMRQPEVDPSATLQEYQDALNKIPFGVKQQFPGYQWEPQPNFKMSWRSMTAGNPDSADYEPVEKWLVPGTAEPYYLEGESQHLSGRLMMGLAQGLDMGTSALGSE